MKPEDPKPTSGSQTSEGGKSPNVSAGGNVTINYAGQEENSEDKEESRKQDRKFGRNTALMAAGIGALATIVVALLPRNEEVSSPPPSPGKVSIEGEFTVQSAEPVGGIIYSHTLPYGAVQGLASIPSARGGAVYKLTRIDFDRDRRSGDESSELIHKALVSRIAGPAVRVDANSSELTAEFCTILKKDLSDGSSFAFKFSCELPGKCKVVEPAMYFEECPANPGLGFLDRLGLIDSVYADAEGIRARQYSGDSSGWIAPSLATLRSLRQEGFGFTEFKLSSGPIGSIESARWIALAVRTNGTPVYFDGLPPKYNPVAFDPSVGVAIEFGLENLAFRGQNAGTETIEIDLYFLDENGEVVASDTLSRDYVALRDAAPVDHLFKGATIRWEAEFLHASSGGNQYTVNLLSSQNVTPLVNEANYLTDQRVAYDEIDEALIVGVVRPPLGENLSYGVVAGLQHGTGKIQFTFDRDGALRLCKWLIEGKARYEQEFRNVRTDIYTYEIGPGRSIQCR